jgi:hypothetical protein
MRNLCGAVFSISRIQIRIAVEISNLGGNFGFFTNLFMFRSR